METLIELLEEIKEYWEYDTTDEAVDYCIQAVKENKPVSVIKSKFNAVMVEGFDLCQDKESEQKMERFSEKGNAIIEIYEKGY